MDYEILQYATAEKLLADQCFDNSHCPILDQVPHCMELLTPVKCLGYAPGMGGFGID